MLILGLSCFYHDAAACLLEDGVIRYAAEEERFQRIKHYSEFPIYAVESCLDETGLVPGDLDAVVFHEKPLRKFERVIDTHVHYFPRSWRQFRDTLPVWFGRKLYIERMIRDELHFRGDIRYAGHHPSHAAHAFFSSPFEAAAVLTADGVGERFCMMSGLGEGSRIQPLTAIEYPHSYGLLYSAVTAHLGFRVNEGEGKVMGLAAYGEPEYLAALRRVAAVHDDGSLRLNMDYFAFPYRDTMFSDRFSRRFFPPRQCDQDLESQHHNLAASLQCLIEEGLLRSCRLLHTRTGLRRLCLGGGLALNSLANGRLLRDGPFDEIYVPPSPGDGGCAAGAAQWYYQMATGHGQRHAVLRADFGPEYLERVVVNYLHLKGIPYRRLEPESLVALVAAELAAGKLVGWFQGRMEYGPRALGYRSILADPRDPAVKEKLNTRIKHRESFRPYAVSIREPEIGDWFEQQPCSPFMSFVAPVSGKMREAAPGAVHRDGTCRLHSVSAERQPIFAALLEAFHRQTGVPLLINTSFNVMGEPIVCNPREAVECFRNTEMDILVIGKLVLERREPGEVDA